jgi:hypothetical protein
MLSDVGVLFIDVPDLFTSRTGLHYFHVAHVFYYSVISLTNILNVNNFEVLSINNKLKFHAHKKPPWTIHVIAKKSDRPIPLKKFTYSHEDVKLIKKRWI